MIVAKACSQAFADNFQNEPQTCRETCQTTLGGATEEAAEDNDLRYSLRTAAINQANVPCRMLHAIRALSNPSECPAAFGQGDCTN